MADMPLSDDWGIASAAYAARTEYVTRPSAEALISWVHEESPLSARNVSVLDNGAGSGVVTIALRARFTSAPILAADLSAGMLRIIEEKHLSDVCCKVLDAINLSEVPDDTFTHSLSTFMIQFTSEPLSALREMYRVTKPAGIIGLGMWGELCFDAPWEETVRHFEPSYTYPRPWSPDWQDENRLREHIEAVGFKDVQMKTIRPRWDFQSPEEYFKFYLESQNPYFMAGYQAWWDKGKEGIMRPLFERIVRENYGGAKDFDMKVWLFIARKKNH